MDMVEKVARAIMIHQGMREADRDLARAAIAAMREPTPEMQRKFDAEGDHTGFQEDCPMCGGHLEGWRRMIDAALSEPKEG